MGILASFTAYVTDTYYPEAMILAIEVILVGMNFLFAPIYGELKSSVFDWHTLFMAAECFCYLLILGEKKLLKCQNVSVAMNIITGLLAYAGRKRLWVFTVPTLVVNAIIRLNKRTTDFAHIAINSIMGILIYIAYEKFSHFVPIVYVMKSLQIIVLLKSADLFVAVKSLAPLVFDILYRLIGDTENGFYVTFASVFVIHFISQILKDYKK